jgi:hypothetical protein
MGIFGELDVASAADDPFKVPANVYEASVTDVTVGPTKDGSKVGMTLIYTITEDSADGEHVGKTVREWKEIPQPANPKVLSADDKKAMSWLKARLLSLGVPENRVNTVEPSDLIGKDVTIVVKEGKGDFMNVNKVTLKQNVAPAGKGSKFSK